MKPTNKEPRSVPLSTLSFVPLSEVKAKLSEHVRGLAADEKRIVITVAGRPAAVLIAYDEFVRGGPAAPRADEVIDIEQRRAERPERERIRDSLLARFDVAKLSRKGQKSYKQKKVRDLGR